MLSLITTCTQIPKSHDLFPRLNYPLLPSLIFEINPNQRVGKYKKSGVFNSCLGFREVRKAWGFEKSFDNSWRCWCKESEGDIELESQIMDFMEKSEKPTMFPTKAELLKAGRADLVESIKKRGGWYSLGWDEENVADNVEGTMDSDIREFQRRVEIGKESASGREQYDDSLSRHYEKDYLTSGENFSPGNLDSASVDRPLEIGGDEDSGIEGILSRLEKQRNSDFGINLPRNKYEGHSRSKHGGDDKHFSTSSDVARTDFGGNGRLPHKGIMNTSNGTNTEQETWRTWSNRRAGSQYAEFEAAEISFSRNDVDAHEETYHVGIAATNEEYHEALDRHEVIDHHEIQTRLQHLESELTTALYAIKTIKKEYVSEEVFGNLSDVQELSDALEFQENEVMAGQDRMRSIKAKMAVLEGKMTLALTSSRKRIELKQERVDNAQKALPHIRSTCIVWPNSAAEVLLAGSFDGWTTQRKMQRSRSGVFSVFLKLYPGKYEIKFIVDGVWKVDPLRPTVNNNGHENNVLIVT